MAAYSQSLALIAVENAPWILVSNGDLGSVAGASIDAETEVAVLAGSEDEDAVAVAAAQW
jgi:hypothetical protein